MLKSHCILVSIENKFQIQVSLCRNGIKWNFNRSFRPWLMRSWSTYFILAYIISWYTYFKAIFASGDATLETRTDKGIQFLVTSVGTFVSPFFDVERGPLDFLLDTHGKYFGCRRQDMKQMKCGRNWHDSKPPY
jgi:hypothetical protein